MAAENLLETEILFDPEKHAKEILGNEIPEKAILLRRNHITVKGRIIVAIGLTAGNLGHLRQERSHFFLNAKNANKE